MSNKPFQFNRDLFFAEFKELPFVKRQLLRQIAREKLQEYSPEEIGSSDVSNAIFSLWKEHCKDFDSILEHNSVEA